jgi:hypothetical protein
MRYVIVLLVGIITIGASRPPQLPVYKSRVRKVEPKVGALDRYVVISKTAITPKAPPVIRWVYGYYNEEVKFQFEYKTNITSSNWLPYTSTTNLFMNRPTNKIIFLRMRAYHPSINYYSEYAKP